MSFLIFIVPALNERLNIGKKMENPFEDKFEKMMDNIHDEHDLF